MRMKKHWFAAATVATILVPQLVFAQTANPNANPYKFPDDINANIPVLVNRIVYGALSLAGAIFFVMFLWGGVTYLMAGGSSDDVKKAIKTLSNAVIGMVIVGVSYILVLNIINVLTKAGTK